MKDYAERLKKEYWKLKERYAALANMLSKVDAGVAILAPGTDLSLLIKQEQIMLEYIKVLEARAQAEGIDLFGYKED